jgi:hypothetical protein
MHLSRVVPGRLCFFVPLIALGDESDDGVRASCADARQDCERDGYADVYRRCVVSWALRLTLHSAYCNFGVRTIGSVTALAAA